MATSIEWTGDVWNPLAGCSIASPGCHNCYAATMAHRLQAMGKAGYEGTTKTDGGWTGRVNLIPAKLQQPLNRKKPQTYFVNSMSDLFHATVPTEFIDNVFAVIAACTQHTFQVLTKRGDRMAKYIAEHHADFLKNGTFGFQNGRKNGRGEKCETFGFKEHWPLRNVILGTSVEDQKRADERFPSICELGEAGWRTMVSIEPLLGPVVIPARYLALGNRAWVIVGGESGPGARPCCLEDIWLIVMQCLAAGVPVFVKQLGGFCVTTNVNLYEFPGTFIDRAWGSAAASCRVMLRDKKGGKWDEWPEQMRVRQMPPVARASAS